MADLKISQLTGATTPLAGTETLPIVQSGATKKVSVDNLTAGRAVSTGTLTVNSDSGETIRSTSTNNTALTFQTYYDGSPAAQISGGDFATNFSGNLVLRTRAQYGGLVDRLSFDSSGDGTLVNGNLIQGTAAKGVNFTANTPAAGKTSQLLNWYEEGTFTPSFVCGTSGTITSDVANGFYTRVGRVVHIHAYINVLSVSSPVGELRLSGLPFAVGNTLGKGGSFAVFAFGLAATAITSLVGVASAGNSYAVISKYGAGGVSNLAPDVQNGTILYASFSYLTA